LSRIVKAYDVRGTVPDELNERVARALGAAFVATLREAGDAADAIVLGYDMRESSPGLATAFAGGAGEEGARVIDAGLGSTDMLYYASGALDVPGAMFTASHNPASYNGIKLCRAGARPIGQDSGLTEIRDRAQALLDAAEPSVGTTSEPSVGTIAEPSGTAAEPSAGTTAEPSGGTTAEPSGGTTGARGAGAPEPAVERRDLLTEYARYLRGLIDLSKIRPLRVVVDAGNGMAGHTVPAVLGDAALDPLPLDIVPLYFELDGTFPNHEANPLDPANLVDLQTAVRAHAADLGLAFDGDADRCFVVDEHGEPVSPSAITALVAVRELAKHPGGTVIHNLITSSAVPEIVREHGGEPVRTRVGHSFIKAEMARTGAVFGGEHSAHYYFKDFWYADTGMLAAMHVLAALGEQDDPLSRLAAEYRRYAASGEVNSTVRDQAATLTAVAAALESEPGAVADHLDGLTVRFPDGAWINLRPSNTEPLLRLNVEAPTGERMAALRDRVLGLVRG
jgi:phosphomannomutase